MPAALWLELEPEQDGQAGGIADVDLAVDIPEMPVTTGDWVGVRSPGLEARHPRC
jgi:hypothetical protein